MPTIDNIKLLKYEESLEKGFFLCLVGCNNVPPHIALIADGRYYSASVRGVKLGVDYKSFLKIVKSKNTETLFIKIETRINQFQLVEAYEKYPKLLINQSCLSPIKDYFKKQGSDIYNWNFVFDMIDSLVVENKIEAAYHLQMEKLLKRNSFELKQYTKDDIKALIKELKALC